MPLYDREAIRKLQDERDRYRAALKKIADEKPYPGFGEELQTIAREALK